MCFQWRSGSKGIDLCNELTAYLKSIKKTNETGNTHQLTDNKEVEANYTKFLENASLKKEKLIVQVPKRAQEIDHPAALSKKKRKEMALKQKKLEAKKEASTKQEEEEKVEVLYHHPEVLRNFDLIKIEPPNSQEDIDKTVAVLEEKCKYFFDLRDAEEAKGEEETEGAPQEEKREEAPEEGRRVIAFLEPIAHLKWNCLEKEQGGRPRREDSRRAEPNFELNATEFPTFE